MACSKPEKTIFWVQELNTWRPICLFTSSSLDQLILCVISWRKSIFCFINFWSILGGIPFVFWRTVCLKSNKTTFLVQRSQDWILTNPFIIILSFFSYLVTFHFWRFPFLILSLPICHAVLVSESFLTWVFQSQRKNYLSPGLSRLDTWRPTCPFVLRFSDQLFPCVRHGVLAAFFQGLYFLTHFL